jgi:hypothetical protein
MVHPVKKIFLLCRVSGGCISGEKYLKLSNLNDFQTGSIVNS